MVIADKSVDLLIIVPPAGITNTIFPPYGAMYIAGALRNKGYNPTILNADAERISKKEVIERIKVINPEYIGFSGIVAPSYKYIKELSLELRELFPDKTQILGGGLFSAFDTVLKNTAIDIVVHGEGDITICELLDCLRQKGELKNVLGIYYRKASSCEYTGKRPLIKDLDILPYPAFDLVDMEKYITDGVEFIRLFRNKIKDKKILDKRRSRRMIVIQTSRGCFGECSFCFRAYRGIRGHSIDYIFSFIEYCMDKFNVDFFSFGDECFAANKTWNWKFIEEFKKRKLDIIFRISGMRVDTVAEDILKAYKEIGCWMIEYGFESGSQKMLNIMNKRVDVDLNKKVALWTNNVGIYTSPTLVLAMPGENDKTIQESIDFVKSLNFDFKQYQWSYALPIPGSALYSFAKLSGAIEDEDDYLSSLQGNVAGAAILHVNLTDEKDEVVIGWAERIKNEIDAYCLRQKYKIKPIMELMRILEMVKLHCRNRDLLKLAIKKIKLLVLRNKLDCRKFDKPKNMVRFRKKDGLTIENLFAEYNYSKIDNMMALKNINNRLQKV